MSAAASPVALVVTDRVGSCLRIAAVARSASVAERSVHRHGVDAVVANPGERDPLVAQQRCGSRAPCPTGAASPRPQRPPRRGSTRRRAGRGRGSSASIQWLASSQVYAARATARPGSPRHGLLQHVARHELLFRPCGTAAPADPRTGRTPRSGCSSRRASPSPTRGRPPSPRRDRCGKAAAPVHRRTRSAARACRHEQDDRDQPDLPGRVTMHRLGSRGLRRSSACPWAGRW